MPIQMSPGENDLFFNTIKAYTVDSDYCAGELTLEDGQLEKINHHVSSFYSGKNNVKTSSDQNRQVRAAVIGCMMDHYEGGAGESSVAKTILNKIYGEECQFKEVEVSRGEGMKPKRKQQWVSTCDKILSRDEVSYVLSKIDSVIGKKGSRFAVIDDKKAKDRKLLDDIVSDVRRIREIKREGVNDSNRADAMRLLHSVSAKGFFSGSAAVMNPSANYRNESVLQSDESGGKEGWTPSTDETPGRTPTPSVENTPTPSVENTPTPSVENTPTSTSYEERTSGEEGTPTPDSGDKRVIIITEGETGGTSRDEGLPTTGGDVSEKTVQPGEDLHSVSLTEKSTKTYTYFSEFGTEIESHDEADMNQNNNRIESENIKRREADLSPKNPPKNSGDAFRRTFSSLPPQLGMEFELCNDEAWKKDPRLENHRRFSKLAVKWFEQGNGNYGLLYHQNFTQRIPKCFKEFGGILADVKTRMHLDDVQLNEVFDQFIADKARHRNFRFLCAMDDDNLRLGEDVAIEHFKREFTGAFYLFADGYMNKYHSATYNAAKANQ